MIVVKGLVKRFHAPSRGPVTAVNGLSLRVDAGQVYGLLGPNGAGKTTTLRVLATLTEPDEGSVVIAGIDRLANPLGVRERIAYVPAEGGLPPRLTPREVTSLFARIQGVEDPDTKSDEALKKMGAGPYADTPCAELSTGMNRRVVLARSMVHAPQVLLLDEPTDGLDVAGRRDVLALIRAQAELGRAVVLSSHIMGEVERVVDRVGVMAHGRMVFEGTLEEALETTGEKDLDAAFLVLTGEA